VLSPTNKALGKRNVEFGLLGDETVVEGVLVMGLTMFRSYGASGLECIPRG